MQYSHLTFSIIGISGNLSRLKILPSIAEFQSKHPEITCDIIGYSRSTVTIEEVQNIVGSKVSIRIVQGEYSQLKNLTEILAQNSSKNHLTVLYLAVPPEIIIPFLENITLPESPCRILIEKPFGRNKTEAEEILQLLESKQLSPLTHCIDHYRFKPSLNDPLPKDINTSEEVYSIHTHALETVGVENRLGYYASTGAIKDMFVHLYSLTTYLYQRVTRTILDTSLYDVTNVQLGQYSGLEGNFETYFHITFSQQKHTELPHTITMESGKRLQEKRTGVLFKRQNHTIEWNLFPKIHLLHDNKEVYVSQERGSDHLRIFESILAGNLDQFISITEVLHSWDMFDLVQSYIQQQKVTIPIYIPDTYPPLFEK